MSSTFDVIVIGGGIVGLSAAIAMSQHDFSVALIDKSALSTDTLALDPRVYAINQASESLFKELGVWDHLNKTRASPYRHMHVWDSVSQAEIDFDARMIATDKLGTILEESILKEALLHQLSKENIVLFEQSQVTGIQLLPDEVQIACNDQMRRAQLLIVADGANSFARQLLGVSLTSWSYHQDAIVTLVHTEKPHQQTAYQVFLKEGPLAFLPLADSHQCSIVWSTSKTHADLLMNLNPQKFSDELTQAFEHRLGICRAADKRHLFPLHMRHAKQYSGPRWLLMGDAAHTIHPLAGLGLNLGLADLQAWMKHLNEHHHFWSPKLLGAYQRQRKYAVWQMILLMEGLKTAFNPSLPPIPTLRGLGIKACNRLLPIKRRMIELATSNTLY